MFVDKIPLENTEVFFDKYCSDVYSVFLLHINIYQNDSLYWFCDLEDSFEQKAVNKIQELILKNKIKLYVQVPSRSRLPKNVINMIRNVKGKLIVKKP